jgi:hypothetical protein
MSRRLALLLVGCLLMGAVAPAAAQRPGRDEARRARVERVFSGAPPSFRSWVEALPPEQRRPLMRRLGRMPEQRREHLFRRWEGSDDAERERFKRFFERRAARRGERAFPRHFEALPPESRERLEPLVKRWRGMEPSERRRMRRRLEHFRALPEDEQEALIERRFGSRPPEERARILESLREASRALPKTRPPPPVPPAD